MGVIVPIESAFFALFVGLANASAVMVGRSLGADDKEDAWRLQKIFDRLTIILVVLLSLLLWWLRPWILCFFDRVQETAACLFNYSLMFFCALVWIKIWSMDLMS